MNQIEFKKNDPKITKFARHFGGYRGRRAVRLRSSKSYHVSDYWDGGSRTYSVFVNAETGIELSDSEASFQIQKIANPFHQRCGSVELQCHIAVVENRIFRGKDMGISVIMHPDNPMILDTIVTALEHELEMS
jgi:hypothetical protein